MAGLELFGDEKDELSDQDIKDRIPFKDVYIHGTVRMIRVEKCQRVWVIL